MGFKATLFGAMLLSGAIGGGLAYFNASGDIHSVGDVAASAKNAFRNTLRKFDKRYYTRGPDYDICVANYGNGAAGRTNAEITLACECFDKNLRMIGGGDRDSARAALRPALPVTGSDAADAPVDGRHTTAAARTVLNRCAIRPAATGPGFPSMRGTI